MSNVFGTIGVWLKRFFFAATALAVAGLNLLMLMDVFNDQVLFVAMGMVFFSIATWVYLVTAFSATEDSSGVQVSIAWAGLVISLIGELSMAVFEIVRMQKFVLPPIWINTVVVIVIEVAIIVHLLLGIAYFAASGSYNERLNRLFENSRRKNTEEKIRKSRADAELHIQKEATDQGIQLTRSMLEAALPVVAERKARMMASEIARTFGLDADPSLQGAFEQAIREYKDGYTTRALHPELVIDSQAQPVIITPPPANPMRPAASRVRKAASQGDG